MPIVGQWAWGAGMWRGRRGRERGPDGHPLTYRLSLLTLIDNNDNR
jgi:hypothetical protein